MSRSGGFNEAALLRVRKDRPPTTPAGLEAGFNEAALLRVRKGRGESPCRSACARFNEAALLRVRKDEAAIIDRLIVKTASMRPHS